MEKQSELDELFDVVNEIRRCVALFWDETQTNLEVEDYNDNIIQILDTDTGNRYIGKFEKLN